MPGSEAVYAEPDRPPWWSPDAIRKPVDRVYKGARLRWDMVAYQVVRKGGVVPRAKAHGSAAVTGAAFPRRSTFLGFYWFRARGGRVWVLTEDGARVPMSALRRFEGRK